MWALIKAARMAYKTWKSLDPEDREALAKEAKRVRVLSVELGGTAAARFVDGDSDHLDDGTPVPPSHRPRDEVAAELREAVEALSLACVGPGTQIARESTPRSVRFGARVAKSGIKRFGPRLLDSMPGHSMIAQPALPGAAVAAAWYKDPYERFTHRYWDGREWTHHVSRDGVEGTDPPTPEGVAAVVGESGDGARQA